MREAWTYSSCMRNLLYFSLITTSSLVAQTQSLLVEARVLAPLIMRLPDNYDATKSYPLVIALHGRGGSAASMINLREAMGARTAIFAAPQGAYPAGPGYSWFLDTQDRAVWPRADALMLDQLLGTLHGLRQRHHIGNVYLLGHSQGAGVAYLLATRARSEVSGLLCFGAGDPLDMADTTGWVATKGLPVFLSHGRQDAVVPFSKALAAQTFFQAQGVAVTFEPYIGGHGLETAPLRKAWAWIEARENRLAGR